MMEAGVIIARLAHLPIKQILLIALRDSWELVEDPKRPVKTVVYPPSHFKPYKPRQLAHGETWGKQDPYMTNPYRVGQWVEIEHPGFKDVRKSKVTKIYPTGHVLTEAGGVVIYCWDRHVKGAAKPPQREDDFADLLGEFNQRGANAETGKENTDTASENEPDIIAGWYVVLSRARGKNDQ